MEEQIVVALITAQVDWIRGAITQRLTVESDPELRDFLDTLADQFEQSVDASAWRSQTDGRHPPAAMSHASNSPETGAHGEQTDIRRAPTARHRDRQSGRRLELHRAFPELRIRNRKRRQRRQARRRLVDRAARASGSRGAAAASSDRALEPGKDDPSKILREFVADCLAAGQNDFDEACSHLRNVQDWPDLEKTFRRARACVETLDALHLRLMIDVVYNPNGGVSQRRARLGRLRGKKARRRLQSERRGIAKAREAGAIERQEGSP